MLIRGGLVSATRRARSIGKIDLAVRYNPLVRRTVSTALRACRTGDPEQRDSVIENLTAAIIRRAQRTRYGRHFGPALEDWPVLDKTMVRDDPSAFIAPGRLRVPATTGGTTGSPLLLQHSLRCIAAEQVFLDDILAPHGLTWARARIAVLRGDTIKPADDLQPPFAKLTHGGRRLVLSSPHLSAARLDWYLDRLHAFRPDMLYVMPTMLANLLMLLEQTGRSLHVPLVLASSERLDNHLYHSVQSVLGAPVIDYYGQTERAALAVRTGDERWRFEPAYGRVELRPTGNDVIENGRRYVPIIATGFWNTAQPLIRYNTGDFAIVPESAQTDLAAIARGEKPFFGIAGRAEEFVFTPDGRRIAALNHLPRDVRHVLRLQVIQDSLDHLMIHVLATPHFGAEDSSRLLSNARLKVPSSMRIDIAAVDRLETTPCGKAPFIIRRVAPEPVLRDTMASPAHDTAKAMPVLTE